jgi:hypothetical protein
MASVAQRGLTAATKSARPQAASRPQVETCGYSGEGPSGPGLWLIPQRRETTKMRVRLRAKLPPWKGGGCRHRTPRRFAPPEAMSCEPIQKGFPKGKESAALQCRVLLANRKKLKSGSIWDLAE